MQFIHPLKLLYTCLLKPTSSCRVEVGFILKGSLVNRRAFLNLYSQTSLIKKLKDSLNVNIMKILEN